ncbi:MAG: phosphoenolpyruvate kinase [Myxococcota bacterium]|nr:phosphoenolpyruvate kinase [Myxococcota bacterium]MDW8361276.1 phosphoenolpyruvate kinase [Myxococcales bacterium]
MDRDDPTPRSEPRDELQALFEALRAQPQAPATLCGGQQPLHTVYGGAHLFRADVAVRLGRRALEALERWAPDARAFARAIGMRGADDPADPLPERVHARVRARLERLPVEDLRVDFEDGFGVRSDAEEDEHADRVAQQLVEGARNGTLPPLVGIRVRALDETSAARAVRTLERVVRPVGTALGTLPSGFVVTLPKVRCAAQPRTLARLLDRIERSIGLPPRTIPIELMIELPQALFGPDGRIVVRDLLDACEGRCRGLHFGTYDYTAACDVTAAHQAMDHPLCDFALAVLKNALSGTGVWLSDGATTELPVPPEPESGDEPDRARRNAASVHAAWRRMYANVQRALRMGIYQGWDLHPAQLPVRHAAVQAFFLEGIDSLLERLRNFVDRAARATRTGALFDDAATGQGLLNHVLRALHCGAIDVADLQAVGLAPDEIATRSFSRIVAARAISEEADRPHP